MITLTSRITKRVLILAATGMVASILLIGCGPKAPDVPKAPTSSDGGATGTLNNQGQAPAAKLGTGAGN